MFKAIAISGFLGFVLIFVGLLGFAWMYGKSSGRSVIQLKGTDMVLRRGEGYLEDTKLVVTDFDAQKRIRIISKQVSFRAEDMPFMAWTFSKFSPRTGVWVAWVTKQDPTHLNMIPAILPFDSTAVYRMKGHPEWQGDIVALGFGFDRQMHDSFTLDSVEIRPYSVGSMLESMLDEWFAFEGWSMSSINMVKGGSKNALIRPVPLVFIWVVLVSLIYQFKLNERKRLNWRLPVVFLITGWVFLDFLWQINLFRQNYLSYQLYAGKNISEKRLLTIDEKLFSFSEEVKRYFPNTKERILLTGKGMSNNIIYEQPRLQYYLMPYNVSYFENGYAVYYKDMEDYNYRFNIGYYVNVGDYLLVSGQDDRIEYDVLTKQMIVGAKYRFTVDVKYKSDNGSLYYIQAK